MDNWVAVPSVIRLRDRNEAGAHQHQLRRLINVVGVSARPQRPGTPVRSRLPIATGTWGVLVVADGLVARGRQHADQQQQGPAAQACGEQAVGYSWKLSE